MDAIELWTVSSSNGINFELPQIRQFERYRKELLYWNDKVNLISRTDTPNIFERHFLHSLTPLKYTDFPQKARVLDIGTGGGFPGLPLAIVRPDLHVLLTDSIHKKLKITEMFAQHTGLRHVKARTIRVEDLAQEKSYIGSFDIITARAVASMGTLIEWTHKLLKPNGKYVFLKGGDLTKEIEDAKEAFPTLTVEEIPIIMLGADWFEQEKKKIFICRL
ncbi:MAG: 16S rRNA (guanine(527)-N(7))-methyltransferase RsmG [Ignavibacteria bacterium]|nr:16S rRNA (guanine(527)-N(7))-methyltransferase RsmG [Ignavibacteria bacterium]